MTFTPRDNATAFETASPTISNAARVVTWLDVTDHIQQLGGTATSAKGTTEDTGDSYDPRFAFDARRQRSQAEREQVEIDREKKRKDKETQAMARKQQAEQEEKNHRLRLLSRSSLDVIGSTNDGSLGGLSGGASSRAGRNGENMEAVSNFGTVTSDSMFHNSVLGNDLDHELSWQYKGGDGRTLTTIETEEEARLRYEREEQQFRQQRAEVEADLSVARTALAVRNLEAAQHIETVGRELNKRMKNGKSKTHRLLHVRADAAAEIAKVSSDAEKVREKVQKHIDSVEYMLRMRRDTKDQRRHDEASSIAKNTLHNKRGGARRGPEQESSGEEDEDEMELVRRVRGSDGVLRLPARKGKKAKKSKQKIFVDSSDPEMRMLFADYEHGTKVRQKILQVRTVHRHITEEEAFLALIECNSDVDRAIGKLTDARFVRDLRMVSELTRESKPGAFAHATATAMHKGSEQHQRGEGLGQQHEEGEGEEGEGGDRKQNRTQLVGTYDKWVEYREEREQEDQHATTRTSLNRGGAGGGGRKNGAVLGGKITHNVKELGTALALSSPYMAAPFTRAKPSKMEKRIKERIKRKGTMANSFPAHIEGALVADAKWKKRGGVRKILHQNRGVNKKRKLNGNGERGKGGGATRGSGARAAAAVSVFFLFVDLFWTR